MTVTVSLFTLLNGKIKWSKNFSAVYVNVFLKVVF